MPPNDADGAANSGGPGPEVIKLCSCSTQLGMKFKNVHKYKNIKKFGLFKAQLSLECLFFPLIHVKMPTIVGILTFMSGENFMLN